MPDSDTLQDQVDALRQVIRDIVESSRPGASPGAKEAAWRAAAAVVAVDDARGDPAFMERLHAVRGRHHRVPFCVEPGWRHAIPVRRPTRVPPDYRLLGYGTKDQPMEDYVWRFEHLCDRGERGVIICAPRLAAHRVTGFPLLVEPSISCPDCGTHGFVREGRWVDAA